MELYKIVEHSHLRASLNKSRTDTSQHFVFGADTDPGNNFTFNFGQDSTFHGYETNIIGNSDANGIGFEYTVPTGYILHYAQKIYQTQP